MATNEDQILAVLKRQNDILEHLVGQVKGIRDTLDRFTDEGSSFRSSQPDAVTLAYLAIVGSVLGDRLDGTLTGVRSTTEYQEKFLKAAALLARSSLQVVDDYRSHRAPLQALEEALKQPGQ
jgi:hypothetical protein